MVTIRNTDAALILKVTEKIQKETVLAPGQTLETDPNTVEIELETST